MTSILLIENSSSLTQIIGLSLKQAGFQIQRSRSYQDAFEAMDADYFDVILCDLDITDRDIHGTSPQETKLEENESLNMVTNVCDHSRKAHSSLLAFTNERFPSRKTKALASGADRCITKPFDVDDLVNDVLLVMH